LQESFIASLEDLENRIDRVLSKKYPAFSRTYFQYLIEQKAVLVNQQPVKKRHSLKIGDTISIDFILSEESPLIAQQMPLDILFEDDHIIVINKPAGMVVHPAPGHFDMTFVNGLLFHCKNLQCDGTLRPGIVHRLDKETSGVLIAAKTREAQSYLVEQFSSRQARKHYLAICFGRPKALVCDGAIGRHPTKRQEMAIVEGGKEAYTEFKIEVEEGNFCLVSAYPKTGRTHQIRVHLKALGAPIVGDGLYSNQKGIASRHMLHANALSICHPITKERMLFKAPLAKDMNDLLISHFSKNYNCVESSSALI
jgi:23S rRNA pseudouridine1911/1915/1917 synthase